MLVSCAGQLRHRGRQRAWDRNSVVSGNAPPGLSAVPYGPQATPAGLCKAIELWTTGSAYAVFAEHERGRLVPGRLADWVALPAAPLTTDPDELRHLAVLQTAVGGDVVYEA